MSEVAVFIIAGLITGSVYSMAGVGLVLTYRTSGILNFAYGGLASVAGYLLYTLMVQLDLPSGVAVFLAVFVLGPLMGLAFEVLARSLQRSPLALRVAATVGVLIAIESAIILIYGTESSRSVPVFLGSGSIDLFGVMVHWSQVATFGIGLAATVVLSIYLRASSVGLAMRAVVDDADLLDVSGISPRRARRTAWVIGSTLAAASGVLFAPLLPLDPRQITLFVISAFAAAVIGGLKSLWGTFVGGLVIGVLASLSTRYFTEGLLAGLAPALPFLALFIVLLIYPKRLISALAEPSSPPRALWKFPWPITAAFGVVLLAFAAVVPSFAGIHLSDWTTALAMAILFLSLGLLVRTSGQASLCQVSFAAVGAAAFCHFTIDMELPWLVALLLSGLVVVPIGAVLAIPAIRLPGIYLALATFGFGILLQYVFYTENYMFGSDGLGLSGPRPDWTWFDAQSDLGFYRLVLILLLVCVGVVVVIERTRLGRLLRGVSDTPTVMQASGASIGLTKVLVYCLSAMLAGVSGALFAVSTYYVSADTFQPFQSLTYFTLVVIIGFSNPWNGLMAAVSLFVIPSYLGGTTTATVLQLIFGLFAVLLALSPESSQHLPPWFTSRVDRWFRRSAVQSLPEPRLQAGRPPEGENVSGRASARGLAPATPSGFDLKVSGLRVAYGGHLAVDDISITAPAGQVTGLIGPNGAGKTTTFNACSGFVRPSGGRIELGGEDVTHYGIARRARLGLGRTFQLLHLFESLTVRENVRLGAEARYANFNPTTHFLSSRATRRRVEDETRQALELCQLEGLADRPVASLSTGHRRLVDLARCLAGQPKIVLLDEPSSGLDSRETEAFGRVIEDIVKSRGIGVLLVEHDLPLVLDLCREIYVLDFGELLFRGTPAEVRESPIVRTAYLGDEIEDRSGDSAQHLMEAR